MRRFTLSTKLFAAAMPLIVAVAALLALTVRADFHEISRAERSALQRAFDEAEKYDDGHAERANNE